MLASDTPRSMHRRPDTGRLTLGARGSRRASVSSAAVKSIKQLANLPLLKGEMFTTKGVFEDGQLLTSFDWFGFQAPVEMCEIRFTFCIKPGAEPRVWVQPFDVFAFDWFSYPMHSDFGFYRDEAHARQCLGVDACARSVTAFNETLDRLEAFAESQQSRMLLGAENSSAKQMVPQDGAASLSAKVLCAIVGECFEYHRLIMKIQETPMSDATFEENKMLSRMEAMLERPDFAHHELFDGFYQWLNSSMAVVINDAASVNLRDDLKTIFEIQVMVPPHDMWGIGLRQAESGTPEANEARCGIFWDIDNNAITINTTGQPNKTIDFSREMVCSAGAWVKILLNEGENKVSFEIWDQQNSQRVYVCGPEWPEVSQWPLSDVCGESIEEIVLYPIIRASGAGVFQLPKTSNSFEHEHLPVCRPNLAMLRMPAGIGQSRTFLAAPPQTELSRAVVCKDRTREDVQAAPLNELLGNIEAWFEQILMHSGLFSLINAGLDGEDAAILSLCMRDGILPPASFAKVVQTVGNTEKNVIQLGRFIVPRGFETHVVAMTGRQNHADLVNTALTFADSRSALAGWRKSVNDHISNVPFSLVNLVLVPGLLLLLFYNISSLWSALTCGNHPRGCWRSDLELLRFEWSAVTFSQAQNKAANQTIFSIRNAQENRLMTEKMAGSCASAWIANETSAFSNWSTAHLVPFVDSRKNWTEARDFCRSFGGDLAVLAGDNKHLSTQLSAALSNNPGLFVDKYWIGASRLHASTWKWNNGQNISDKQWIVTNQGTTGTCLSSAASSSGETEWRPADCADQLGFICQDILLPPQDTSVCTTLAFDGSWLPEDCQATRHCFWDAHPGARQSEPQWVGFRAQCHVLSNGVLPPFVWDRGSLYVVSLYVVVLLSLVWFIGQGFARLLRLPWYFSHNLTKLLGHHVRNPGASHWFPSEEVWDTTITRSLDGTERIDLVAVRVEIPFPVGRTSLDSTATGLVPFLLERDISAVFASPCIKALTAWKWSAYAKRVHTTELVMFVFFYFLPLLWAVYFGVVSAKGNAQLISSRVMFTLSFNVAYFSVPWPCTTLTVLWWVWFWNIRILLQELHLASVHGQNILGHLSDAWNVLDLLLLACVFQLPFSIISQQGSTGNADLVLALSAVTILFACVKCLSFVRPFNVQIEMVRQVFLSMASFLALLGFMALAFALAFLTIFANEGTTLWSLLYFVIGDSAPIDDHLSTDNGSNSTKSLVAKGLFLLFIMSSAIVLVNLLISILSDTYEKVVEKQEEIYYKQKSIFILFAERLNAQPSGVVVMLSHFRQKMTQEWNESFPAIDAHFRDDARTLCGFKSCQRNSFVRQVHITMVLKLSLLAAAVSANVFVEAPSPILVVVFTGFYWGWALTCGLWLMPPSREVFAQQLIDKDKLKSHYEFRILIPSPLFNFVASRTLWWFVGATLHETVGTALVAISWFYRTPSFGKMLFSFPGKNLDVKQFGIVLKCIAALFQTCKLFCSCTSSRCQDERHQTSSHVALQTLLASLLYPLTLVSIFVALVAFFGIMGLALSLLALILLVSQWMSIKYESNTSHRFKKHTLQGVLGKARNRARAASGAFQQKQQLRDGMPLLPKYFYIIEPAQSSRWRLEEATESVEAAWSGSMAHIIRVVNRRMDRLEAENHSLKSTISGQNEQILSILTTNRR